jgi:CRP/FNR family transcriptional regulator, nitrogen oxide reductase regulator
MSYEQLLQRTPSLAGADATALSRLAAMATSRSYERGAVLWRAGDAARNLNVVKSGLVKVVRVGAGGRRTMCGLFGPPQSIGDVVLLKGAPYPAEAIVATDTATLVTVPRATLLGCLEACPQLGVSIACAIHEKLLSLHNSIDVLSAGAVEARLATALLKLYDQFGDDFDDGTSSIPVTLARRELADLVSTAVETVIRVMTRWQREGVIATDANGFTIHNHDVLRAVAVRVAADGKSDEPALRIPSSA